VDTTGKISRKNSLSSEGVSSMSFKYCAFCGEKLDLNSLFCSQCGTKTASVVPDDEIRNVPTQEFTKETVPLGLGEAGTDVKKYSGYLILGLIGVIAMVLSLQSGVESESTDSNYPPEKVAGLSLVEVPGESTGFSCDETEDPGDVYCIMAIRVKNDGDASKDIYGDIFALVDGKVFKADSTFGGITYVSTDINPGETAASTVAFKVPRGSSISQIFISDTADGGLKNAKLILDLNRIATP
jgi:hypothetical protein